ncbi:hypothetical protein MA16_Dca011553 [Dendrobium catenatum]|uniref:Uncharacterized protein n=1 Tax=Dendrobium catenatum TaxID=906689 RepID=A0A2I0W631_9ASPA|nr:hypothetical protein MA16_Dca011553 [Dendrobium catenatum]
MSLTGCCCFGCDVPLRVLFSLLFWHPFVDRELFAAWFPVLKPRLVLSWLVPWLCSLEFFKVALGISAGMTLGFSFLHGNLGTFGCYVPPLWPIYMRYFEKK